MVTFTIIDGAAGLFRYSDILTFKQLICNDKTISLLKNVMNLIKPYYNRIFKKKTRFRSTRIIWYLSSLSIYINEIVMRRLNLFNYIWTAIYQFPALSLLLRLLTITNFKSTKTLKKRSAFLTLNTLSEKIIYIAPAIY